VWNGTNWVPKASTNAAAMSGQSSSSVGQDVGDYYLPNGVIGPIISMVGGLTNGDLMAFPFHAYRSGTISTISFIASNSGSVDAAVHASLYADNGAMYPGALAKDAGAVTIPHGTNSQTRFDVTVGGGQAVVNGTDYWVVLNFSCPASSSLNIGGLSVSNTQWQPPLGYVWKSGSGSLQPAYGYDKQAFGYGSAPGTFPTSATVMDGSGNVLFTIPVPAVVFSA
jgi:hypothetical protein